MYFTEDRHKASSVYSFPDAPSTVLGLVSKVDPRPSSCAHSLGEGKNGRKEERKGKFEERKNEKNKKRKETKTSHR